MTTRGARSQGCRQSRGVPGRPGGQSTAEGTARSRAGAGRDPNPVPRGWGTAPQWSIVPTSDLCFLPRSRKEHRASPLGGSGWAEPPAASPARPGGSRLDKASLGFDELIKGCPAPGAGHAGTARAPGRELPKPGLIGHFCRGHPAFNRIVALSQRGADPALQRAPAPSGINSSQDRPPGVSSISSPPAGKGLPCSKCPAPAVPLLSRFSFLTSIFTLSSGAET